MWNKLKTFYTAHPVWSGLIAMFLATVVIVWLCMLFLDVWTHHGDTATVPQIKDMPYEQARETLENHGLKIEISDSLYDKSVAPGTVMESWPKAGAVVKAGRSVYVTVTAFSPKHITISMPVTGVSVRQAVSYLSAMGVTSIRYVNVPSEYPDLVEHAHAQGRPIGVGSVIPVDAEVVLEVGVPMAVPADSLAVDSIAAEAAIEQELSGQSSYQEI